MAAHHVVIVGGGFGGLFAARRLAREDLQITLLDRKNHHTFQPLLYQVATAGLNPSDIAFPIRSIFRKKENVEVLLGNVAAIHPESRTITLEDGATISYDTLIVATGATHSYFGHPEWSEVAPGLKTIEDALEIRKRIFFAFEAAEREPDLTLRAPWLTFVVVGGGPTGVELAGTLGEISRQTLRHDFRHIDPAESRILLFEGSPNILGTYVPELRDKAKTQLQHLGVSVQTDARVVGIDPAGVTLAPVDGKPGERIPARTVLWAAGVAASPLAKTLGVPLDRAGRVLVEPDLTVPGHPEIYVIGDVAAAKQGDGFVPGVAPAALQAAKHTAENIVRSLAGQPRTPFRYHDKGSLATIGRASGIADFGRLKLSGFLAWTAWLLIHVFFLIGFRNRFLVMFEWAMSYLTFQRGARLITGKVPIAELPAASVRSPTSATPPAAVEKAPPAPAP
ncbi:MAG: NAD(P)/FAD-dependent oxidoreductase [Byssovorax sp.]